MFGAWTDEELEYLRDNYSIMKNKDIASHLGRTKNAIEIKAERIGLRKPRILYDHHYFDVIDTEHKAYWLGFVYADGYISISEHSNTFGIELSRIDQPHLKKFNIDIQGNVNIRLFDKRLNDKVYNMCSIRLFSKEIVNGLLNHGVTQDKTYTCLFPNIENNLVRHFIRGYMDGDGSIYKENKRMCASVNFTCASEKFLEGLRVALYNNGINSYICQDRAGSIAKKLYIKGIVNCDNYFKFIYDDATIYLDRKYEKYINIYNDCKVAARCLNIRKRMERRL